MPTQTAKNRAKNGRRLSRATIYADEAHWLALAAKLSGLSAHEFLSRRIREWVRKELTGHGVNPDRCGFNGSEN